jgi:hypothetical protein
VKPKFAIINNIKRFMHRKKLLLFSFIITGVLILCISGLFAYKIYRNNRLFPREILEKEVTTSTPGENAQTVSTTAGVGVLTGEGFKVSFEYPKEWGDFGKRLDWFDEITRQLYPPTKLPGLTEGDFETIDAKQILDSPFKYYEIRYNNTLWPIKEKGWEQLLSLPTNQWIDNPQFQELKKYRLMNNIVFFEKAQEKYSERGKTMSYQQIFEASSTPEFIEIVKEIINEIPDSGLRLTRYKTISGASASLIQYPEDFRDAGLLNGAWWEDYEYLKENKQKAIEPLLGIYNQRTINGIFKESIKRNEDALIGWWWGNMASFQHRILPEYIENRNGNFRGVAYFANEYQDAYFGPSYRVILINPAERLVISFKFALRDLPEIKSVRDEQIQNYCKSFMDGCLTIALREVGYNFLRNPENYKNSELGNLLGIIHQIIRSVKLVQN